MAIIRLAHWHGAVNIYTMSILRRFYHILLAIYTPLATVTNGNCAYSIMLTTMFGTKDQHKYVHLMAAIEITASAMTPSHYPRTKQLTIIFLNLIYFILHFLQTQCMHTKMHFNLSDSRESDELRKTNTGTGTTVTKFH